MGVILLFAGEWAASSRGPPASVPTWLFLYQYFGAPLLMLATLAIAVVASPFLLFAAWRRPERRRLLVGRGICLLLTPLVLWASIIGSSKLRLARFADAAERLTPAAQTYMAARAAGLAADPPVLRLRGCAPLEYGYAPGSESALVAECSRGLGAWDKLFFRADGQYPNRANVERIGSWAYFWD